jgi:hypothetical protein
VAPPELIAKLNSGSQAEFEVALSLNIVTLAFCVVQIARVMNERDRPCGDPEVEPEAGN